MLNRNRDVCSSVFRLIYVNLNFFLRNNDLNILSLSMYCFVKYHPGLECVKILKKFVQEWVLCSFR